MKSFYHFLSASLCAGLLLAFAQQTQAQCVITQIGNDIDGEADGDQSGKSVAISSDGNTVVIGSVTNAGGGFEKGHVRMYKNSGGTWTQHIVDIDGYADGDYSGAAISLGQNDRVAIGSPFNSGGGTIRGHVRVLEPGYLSWPNIGPYINGESDGDNSGWAVSLSENGNRVAVGAPNNAGGGMARGHVRVYQLTPGAGWAQMGNDIDGEADDDKSGLSVSMSADGSTVAIGSIYNAGGGIGRGHVRVYKWLNGAWAQQGADIDGKTDNEQAGFAVSLNSDGTILALSAPYNDVPNFNQGQVRVYQLVNGAWVQQGSDINGEAEGDVFGYSLSLSADGSTLAAGAPFNDGTGGNNRGHVRVYKNIGGVWTQQGSDIDSEADSDAFGWAVDLNQDGSRLVVGAPDNDGVGGNNRGHARVYQICSSCPSFAAAPPEVRVTNSTCGSNCNLSTGNIAAPSGTPCPAGSTLQYQVNGGAWSSTLPTYDQSGTVQTIKTRCNCDSNTATSSPESAGATTAPGICGAGAWAQLGADIDGEADGDNSGWHVSLSADGTTLAIGAIKNALGGHTRVYKNVGGSWVQKGGDIDGEGEAGFSVSLNADGNTLAVGEPTYASPGYTRVGRVRVYHFVGNSWVQQGNDINGDTDHTLCGRALSLSADGATLAVAAPTHNGGGAGRGRVRIYQFTGGAWVQQGNNMDGEVNLDGSGYSVSLSADGSTVVIGAIYNVGGGSVRGRGHARVYKNIGGAWTQLGSDIDGEADNDNSGTSVSINSDGTIVAIGAPLNAGGGTSRGHARVYKFIGGAWAQQGSDIDGEADNNNSGSSVSLSADGNTLAVGAPLNNGSKGHTRVYKFTSGTWAQQSGDIDGEASNDQSGWAVSLSADGSMVAIGAPTNGGAGGINQGQVRAYRFSCPSCPSFAAAPPEVSITNSTCGSNCALSGGSITAPSGTPCPAGSTLQYQVNGGAWSSTLPTYVQNGPAQTIKTRCNCNSEPTMSSPESVGASTVPGSCGSTGPWSQVGMDITGNQDAGQFGKAVSISGDGSIVAIGAGLNDGGGTYRGTVRVYKNVGGTWTQQGNDINGEADNDYSGLAVSMSSDGSTVAVGASGNNGGDGHVRIYRFVAGAWVQQGSDIDAEASGDLSGTAVSLNSDGSIVAIGAPQNDAAGGNDRGHVRVYQWLNGAWAQQGNDIDGEADSDKSGHSVSLSPDGSTVAIGAPFNTGGGSARGHVRVYRFINGAWAQQGGDIDGEADGDQSGWSVALNFDGNAVAIGARNNAGAGGFTRGHVRVYQLTGGAWAQQGSDIDGKEDRHKAGSSVSLSFDGKTVAVGAPGNLPAFLQLSKTGEVYVYKFVGGNWSQQGSDIEGDAIADVIGTAVSLSSDGNTLAIGTPGYIGAGIRIGRAQVFKTGCPSCPSFAAAPSEVSITNSSCGAGCTLSGGSITAPSGTPCPTGSTLQYQVNGGAWSSTLPFYDQDGPAQTIKTRCNCDMNTMVSSAESAGVTTVPGTISNPTVPADGSAIVACAVLATSPVPPVVIGCDGLPIFPSGPSVANSFDPANCEGTRTYTYTYTCGATSSVWNFQYMIERQPFTLPTDGAAIVGCPADAFLPTPPIVQSNCGETLTPSAPTVTDNPIPLAINGTRTYAWIYTDCEGNQATWRFVYTIQTPAPPSIVCPANIVSSTALGQCTALVSYSPPTASVNCGAVTLALTSPPNTASGSVFPKGVTMVSWEASNGSGLTAVCNFTVTVNDTQQPTFTCPTNITRNADANLCTAVVTYPTPTATDNCSPAPTVMHVSGGLSGTAFPKGTTTVQWKATDGANVTRTCTFIVTVNDTQTPSLTCPGNITKNTDAGQCSAVTTYAVNYSDNCPGGGAALQSGLPSGGIFPKGQTTVIWRATDAAGLTKTCSFRVTMNDVEAPVITCPSSQSASTSPSNCTANVTYPTPTAVDNCPGSITVVRISGPTSGSAFSLGVTSVVWRAIDGTGRSSTCSFAVTVTDATPPVITCPGNIAVTAPPGQCSTPVGYTLPSATDNCGVQAVFLLSGLPSGSTFPQGATVNTWRATENTGLSSTCSFTVTVGCGSASEQGGVSREQWAAGLKPETSNIKLQTLNLTLSPNPAISEVQIWIEGLGENGGELLMSDLLGRVLVRQRLTAHQRAVQLDLSGPEFASGLYQVVIRSEEGKIANKPLLINKL